MQATSWENEVLFWDNGFQEQNEISWILAECWGSLAEFILIVYYYLFFPLDVKQEER